MNHLEFSNKLDMFGVQIKPTNILHKAKTIELQNDFRKSSFVEVKDFQCKYTDNDIFSREEPLHAIIRECIDMDPWKHSWHCEIIPENYEKFREIIQDKIIKRASEIDLLLTVYFQLNHEITKEK
jgi:hypothetical protein